MPEINFSSFNFLAEQLFRLYSDSTLKNEKKKKKDKKESQPYDITTVLSRN